jgi:hypothetical protein
MFNESAINVLSKYLRLLKNAMNTLVWLHPKKLILRLQKIWIITLF